MVGTLPYIAPEILIFGESSVTSASDVWAVGCIGFELCTGKTLSHTRGAQTTDAYLENGLVQYVRDLSEIPPRFSGLVRSIIGRCLVDVSCRPTAIEIREYIFHCIKELDVKSLETTIILRSDEPNAIQPNNDDNLTQFSREGIDNSDAEWQSVSHADAVPNMSKCSSVAAEAQRPIERSASMKELTRQFAQEVTLDDSQEPQKDDFSWTTGDDPAIVHKEVIDKGASGEVHEVRSIPTYINLC